MVPGAKARCFAHQQFRRTLLASAAETMFAALQVHVDGCPRCAASACDDATHATVIALREALRVDREARRAELAPDARKADPEPAADLAP